VRFSAEDFNTACQNINNARLDRLTFELPPSSAGTLHANYTSANSPGTLVTSTTTYYRSSSPSISTISFVPASGYTGTVSIPFSGYDVNGARFSGNVKITVTGSNTDHAQVVSYSTISGGTVHMSAADLNNACLAVTGSNLQSVNWTLPSTGGTLYSKFDEATGTGTAVKSNMAYYRLSGTNMIDDVSFVANSGYVGTVTISYTALTTSNGTYNGTVEILVTAPVTTVIQYTGSNAPISFRASDFTTVCESAIGGTLQYIRFNTLPDSTLGQTYINYNLSTATGSPVTLGTSYYATGDPNISNISFVPHVGAEGTVSIGYTGVDTRGREYTGAITISLAKIYMTSSFSDMTSTWNWAKEAVEYLRQSGVTQGSGNNLYEPGRAISRGEFTVMVARAFNFTSSSTTSFPDVSASSYYASAVAAAKERGIAMGGSNGLFYPSASITRQDAMTLIYRAMLADGEYMPTASATSLSGFGDGAAVADYAQTPVETLIQMGVVQGDNAHLLNPTATITRAEMAVILHRVLTS
jgi:hypothetical protein